MASATINYNFPYPVNSDAVDIAGDIQSLAEAIDSELYSFDTDNIVEGSTNLYFTNQRALDATTATIQSASAYSLSEANAYTDSQLSEVSASVNIIGTANQINVISSSSTYTISLTNDVIISNNLSIGGSAQIGGSIIPDVDISYDLGSATNRFKDIYLSGSTIYMGNTIINSVNDGISLNNLTIDNTGYVNEVDGTSGVWSLQAGASGIFLINRDSNTKYSLNMTEESPPPPG